MDSKIILPIGGLLIGGFAVYKILQKIGIVKSASDVADQKLMDKYESSNDNWFTPTKKLPKKALILTKKYQELLAKKLWFAKGSWLNDDEDAIYGVFRLLKTKSQVTSLSAYFYLKYNQDLYLWLKDMLSPSEFGNVLKIVNSKPDYTVK